MAHAIKEKIFNIMRANNFTGIFHTLLELEFKFPLYQQVKFHTLLATRPAFTRCSFLFPVSWTIPGLEALVHTLGCSETSIAKLLGCALKASLLRLNFD